MYYSNLDCFLNKKDEIENLIIEEKPDILMFTEILDKRKPEITEPELKINDYDCFHNTDKKSNSESMRGVVTYIKCSLNAKPFIKTDDIAFEECIWQSFVSANNERVLLGNIYRSPNSTTSNTEKLNELLKSPSLNPFDKIILTGDFNYPNLDWEGGWTGTKNETFMESIRDGFWTQHVDQPTRHRAGQKSNILDLILTKDPNDITSIDYCSPLGKSDHILLKVKTTIKKDKIKEEKNQRYDFNKGNYTEMKDYIKNINWSNMSNNINEDWIFIKDKVNRGMESFIPKVTVTNKKKRPIWMNNQIKKSVKKKYKLFKRFLESDNSWHYHEYIKVRNQVTKDTKKAKYEYEVKVAKESKLNPKMFWRYVNSKRKCKQNVTSLKNDEDILITDDKGKADLLNKYFSSVFTKEDLKNLPHMSEGEKSNEMFASDLIITEEAVRAKLSNLNPNKSPGPDKLYPRILKELCNELAKPLTYFFNLSIEKGELPEEWKLAEVTAVFKKGDKQNPGNYRPISLTCILCKVLESLVRDAIQSHMEDLNLYSTCQYGFRKNRSCTTQLLKVMDDFSNFTENGDTFDTVYLDFKKAFDTVPHERLLTKLKAYGVTGNLHAWIKSFLNNRSQYVKVGKEYSETVGVTSGIPQGSILGPILFLIFINDLPECINSICNIFADDTKIYDVSHKHEKIQEDLNSVLNWSNTWQLHFNMSKCKVIYYGNKNPKHDYYFHNDHDSHTIEKGTEEKDLGVTFDSSLKFDKHINNIVTKANQTLGIIKRNFQFMDKEIFLKLYKALIRPVLEYGQTVWYPHLKRQQLLLEKVQRRATKIVKSIAHLPYHERLVYLNLPSLKYRRKRGDMIQVYNILMKNKKVMTEVNSDSILKLSETHCTRGHNAKLYKDNVTTNCRKSSFSQRVTNTWNYLSTDTVNAPNINRFKNLLDKDLKHKMYLHK